MDIAAGSILDQALTDLQHTLLPEDSCVCSAHARAHNFRYDERATGGREKDYLRELDLQAGTAHEFRQKHTRYYNDRVKGVLTLPPTFLAGNEAAFLTLDGNQFLVRMEVLDKVLAKWKGRDHVETDEDAFQLLGKALHDFRASRTGTPAHTLAVGVLDRFFTLWNKNILRDHRPMFAAFADEIDEAMTSPNWAEEVRIRLGLAHINPRTGNKIPVALMRYKVSEVQAVAAGVASPFAAPTSLDSEIWPYFFPAPMDPARTPGESYGRSMSLTPRPDGSGLIAELLHVKIDYKAEHLFKIGWLSTPIPKHGICELRNSHLQALRTATGRSDFGAMIPPCGPSP